MHNKLTFGYLRIGFAALALLAVISQLVVHISLHYSVVNFFSYFTNLGNILGLVVLAIAGCLMIMNKKPSLAFETIRLAAAIAMVIVGIVFSILLRDTDLGSLLPWVNIVLHYVMPVVLLLDWIIFSPTHRMKFIYVGYSLLFPLAYSIYSLIRGKLHHFYPYPFFNPAHGGYGTVFAYCGVMCVAFIGIGALMWLIGNRGKRLAAL